uniref:Uncharacterized protein n=1 Tax=Angiostrongylus cantonensis TaxID=6313 RepID=A0A158P5P6_ANGCA
MRPPSVVVVSITCHAITLDGILDERTTARENSDVGLLACCPILSQSSLPKRNPVSTAFAQCSILRRLSSTCPVDGFPSLMQIEFFNLAGNVVRTITNTGNTLAVMVSCAQAGSAGADRGFVLGSAVS